jgi:hypothetical protein
MEYLLSILSGGISGGILVWLLKGWISERLKQSIRYEYAEKLESYKTELNSKIESFKHENQVSRLRTSLFFDHQREAFASIIAKIAEVNIKWMENFDPDEGLYERVPEKGYREFTDLIHKHQLFLDEECLIAVSLVENAYSSSICFDAHGNPTRSFSGEPVSCIYYFTAVPLT